MADLIRRGTPADVDAITDLTMRAYSKWLALIGYEPLPMLADYAVAIREYRFDLLEVGGKHNMRVLTITELLQLSRIELYDLAARITNRLPDYPEAYEAYPNARINLRNIRRMITRRSPEAV